MGLQAAPCNAGQAAMQRIAAMVLQHLSQAFRLLAPLQDTRPFKAATATAATRLGNAGMHLHQSLSGRWTGEGIVWIRLRQEQGSEGCKLQHLT